MTQGLKFRICDEWVQFLYNFIICKYFNNETIARYFQEGVRFTNELMIHYLGIPNLPSPLQLLLVCERNHEAVCERNHEAVCERNHEAVCERNHEAVCERNHEAVCERNHEAVCERNHEAFL